MSEARRVTAPANPICVALDAPDWDTNRAVASATARSVGAFKIGPSAFIGSGSGPLGHLAAERPVFLDLKLHDIPHQVAGAVEAVSRLPVAYTTVHAAGGRDMLLAAVEAAGPALELLGVTVLTSLDEAALRVLGLAGSTENAVIRLAELALEAGCPGLVCSPLEIGALRRRFGARSEGGPLLVVPGIRPDGAAAGDQRRTLPPERALAEGADLLVIGRPITAAVDPGAAARALAMAVGE
ncbi:MAG: orotidine-5'-phosphate decarboxylase [Actinobacteria bacterium]|nr:orotidine-5'-phosphate decarboxylase [Actinomycetota bacterium]